MSRISLVGGLAIDRLTMSEVVDQISSLLAQSRRTGRCFQAATVNTDYLANARRDPELRRLLQSMDLLTADGMPLLWAARRHGSPLPERVTGADLVPTLVGRCAKEGHRVALVGGAPGVALQAASLFRGEEPGLVIQGYSCDYFETVDEMDQHVVEEISRFEPDLVLVALGHPKQEMWGERFGSEVNAGVVIGIGGSLDFLTGATARAPKWMRRNGLEWAHRLAREPRRLAPRYMTDFAELAHFMRKTEGQDLEAFTPAHCQGQADDEAKRLLHTADVQVEVVAPDQGRFAPGKAGASPEDYASAPVLVLDLDSLRRIDRNFVTSLVDETRYRRSLGRQTYVCGGGKQTSRLLTDLCVTEYLNYRRSLSDVMRMLVENGTISG